VELRGQTKQRLVFYPLRFKAETGELLYSTRSRVRVKFSPVTAEGGEGRKFVCAQGAGKEGLSASASATAEATDTWGIPAEAAYRLSTAGKGMYRVSRANLAAAGIAHADIDALDLSGVQLFHLGNEQAIHVRDFDPTFGEKTVIFTNP
jgi:hypothetical protein